MIYAVHNILFLERLEGSVNHALVAAVEGARDDLAAEAAEPVLDPGEGVLYRVPVAGIGLSLIHISEPTRRI